MLDDTEYEFLSPEKISELEVSSRSEHLKILSQHEEFFRDRIRGKSLSASDISVHLKVGHEDHGSCVAVFAEHTIEPQILNGMYRPPIWNFLRKDGIYLSQRRLDFIFSKTAMFAQTFVQIGVPYMNVLMEFPTQYVLQFRSLHPGLDCLFPKPKEGNEDFRPLPAVEEHLEQLIALAPRYLQPPRSPF